MVAKTGYEANRRSAESTSRDQTGELQPMEQVGTHAPALFAAQAGKVLSELERQKSTNEP